MNIQERLRETLYPYITQCKRYKKSIGILFVLGSIAMGWGIFYTPDDEHVQMESDSTVISKSEENHETTLLYSTGNNLRALPWREVLGE